MEAFKAEWFQKNKLRLVAKSSARSKSPIGRYDQQRAHAKRRGIPWEFTFDSWWKIWQDSGKWNERLERKYVMCRTGDIGPYSPSNVRIDTHKNNILERHGKFVD